MKTTELIDALAHNLTPVKRLRPPLERAAGWMLVAAAVVALVGIAHGVRSDLAQQLARPAYLVVIAASLGTGVLAAIASFLVSLPDRSWRWALLPVPALLLWLSSIGYQCLTNWVAIDSSGIQAGETLRCFATLALTSIPLSLALSIMLRRAAPLRPVAVTLASALAIAGFAATALWLLHPLDASVMVLVWSAGTMAFALGVATAVSPGREAQLRKTSPL